VQSKTLFLLFFLVTGISNIRGQVLQIGLLAHASKALIIPSLMGYVWSCYSPSRLYLSALLFSWLGDLFLIPEGSQFFVTGIAAFWLTQIIYCRLMLKHLGDGLLRQLKKKKTLLPLLLLGGYLCFMLLLMSPQLGPLQVPVSLYAATLTVTGFLGVLIALEKETKTALYLASGCLLFVISDSLIAFDAFYFKQKVFGPWVMATYIPAQFLIATFLAKKY
jgi:uncharacterized membrane protein YhhN